MLNLRYPEVIPGPPRPSAIIRPGGFSLPAGTERYTVPGGGALLVEIEAGDKVTIANAEGGQACELVALDKDGRSDAAMLGAVGKQQCCRAEGAAALRRRRASGSSATRSSGAASISPVLRPSASSTPRRLPARRKTFTVQRDGSLIVAAPGGPMSLDAQDTVTPLTLMIEPRAHQVGSKIRTARSARRSGARPAHQVGDGGGLFRQGRRLHPDHRRRRPPVHRLPVFFGAQARPRQGPSARRDDDAHADGRRAIRCRACIRNITTRTWSRWSRSCRTPAAGTMPSRSPARRNITTTSAIPVTPTARRTSTPRWPTRASTRAPAGWR